MWWNHTFLLLTVLISLSTGQNKNQHATQQMIQNTYKYHEQDLPDIVGRHYEIIETNSKAFLMCPKQYFISKIHYNFQTSKELRLRRGIKDQSWLYTLADALHVASIVVTPPCGTLKYCIGYQACLFSFSNEFCKNDPLKGIRKVLKLYLTCEKDKDIERFFHKHELNQQVKSGLLSRRDQVMLIKHSSFIEQGIRNLQDIEIFPHVIPEYEVFGKVCDPVSELFELGFRGSCHRQPKQDNSVSEHLWKLLGRVPTSKCRKELTNVYCAFQYDRQGRCVPPDLVKSTALKNVVEFKYRVLPFNKIHPDISRYEKILDDKHQSLIPARIGFILLVHEKADIVMELLDLIYREQHFYVIHVDSKNSSDSTRMELRNLVKSAYGSKGNVKILPKERSFRTSWASYNYIRAHLESLEELLRMGIWDFAINLSAVDLPLRPVDDLAAALAPYRGKSFFYPFKVDNLDRDPLWYSCDSYVYNVGAKGTSPIGLLTHQSVWAIFGRNFAEVIVSSKARQNTMLNEIQFYMMTTRVMDEYYFINMLAQSELKDTVRHKMLTYFNSNQAETIDRLCRHMLDADFCGKGPATFEAKDKVKLQRVSHRTFFARKFSNSKDDDTRKFIISWMKFGFYKNLMKTVTEPVLMQLAELAAKSLEQRLNIAFEVIDIMSWQFLPAFEQYDACCKGYNFEKAKINKLMNFRYLIDFTVKNIAMSNGLVKARASLHPKPVLQCYPWGHLRAMRITTQPDNAKLVDEFPKLHILPVEPAGSSIVWLDVLFDVRLPNEICQKNGNTDENFEHNFAFFPKMKIKEKTARNLYLKASLIDPNGDMKCTKDISVEWNSKVAGKDNFHWVHHKFECGKLTPGLWTLNLQQDEVLDSFIYRSSILLHDEGGKDFFTSKKIFNDLWSVDDVMLLPESNYYDIKNGSDNNEQTNHLMSNINKSKQPEIKQSGDALHEDVEEVSALSSEKENRLKVVNVKDPSVTCIKNPEKLENSQTIPRYESFTINKMFAAVAFCGGLTGAVGLLVLAFTYFCIDNWFRTKEIRKLQHGIYIVLFSLLAQLGVYLYFYSIFYETSIWDLFNTFIFRIQ